MRIVLLILTISFFSACSHPKDSLLEDFGNFINETEAHYEEFSDTEWNEIENSYIEFMEKAKDYENQFDQYEKGQISDYEKRFKKAQIKRDPLNHLIDIFK